MVTEKGTWPDCLASASMRMMKLRRVAGRCSVRRAGEAVDGTEKLLNSSEYLSNFSCHKVSFVFPFQNAEIYHVPEKLMYLRKSGGSGRSAWLQGTGSYAT